jgi:hypothetical protein
MTPCIFLPDENAAGCLVERARRFREHRPDLRPWEKNPCDNCKTGRDRVEVADPPKEEDVAKPDPKERVLATITRRGPCTSTPILQCCTMVKAADLHQFTRELAAEGKIKVWTDGRKTTFTLPGAPDPFQGTEKQAAPAKASRKKAARVTDGPVVRNRIKRSAPSNGSGPLADAIAALEEQRSGALDRVEKIDTALAILRGLSS